MLDVDSSVAPNRHEICEDCRYGEKNPTVTQKMSYMSGLALNSKLFLTAEIEGLAVSFPDGCYLATRLSSPNPKQRTCMVPSPIVQEETLLHLMTFARVALRSPKMTEDDHFMRCGGSLAVGEMLVNELARNHRVQISLDGLLKEENTFKDVAALAEVELKFLDDIDEIKHALEMGSGFAPFNSPDASSFLALTRGLGTVWHHRDSDVDGVTRVEASFPSGIVGKQGLSNSGLLPHSDSAGSPTVPRTLLLWCETNKAVGGASMIASGTAISAQLHKDAPDAYAAFTSSTSAIFFSGKDIWKGPLFETDVEERVRIRLRLDELGYLSVPAARHLSSLERAIEGASSQFQLQAGQGYAIRNDTWLHGRTPYQGRRVMLRTLTE